MKKYLKNFLSGLLVISMLFGTSPMVFAANHPDTAQLKTAYNSIMTYAKTNKIPLNMTYQDFANNYDKAQYKNVQAYANVYYTLLKPQPQTQGYQTFSLSSLGGDSAWYYNTGTSLPQKANYSKYKLLDTCKSGDIIYEASGGFGITGHIAIVEGKFWSTVHNQYYIRVIEAIDVGVVRSILDDQRVDDKGSTVHRVNSANTTQISNAVKFCVGELGSSYGLDFAKDTSSSETDWYCSELAWASYKNQRIDIETTGFLNEPGITPRDIVRCSKVSTVSFK